MSHVKHLVQLLACCKCPKMAAFVTTLEYSGKTNLKLGDFLGNKFNISTVVTCKMGVLHNREPQVLQLQQTHSLSPSPRGSGVQAPLSWSSGRLCCSSCKILFWGLGTVNSQISLRLWTEFISCVCGTHGSLLQSQEWGKRERDSTEFAPQYNHTCPITCAR